ncbi:hypothetical protein [Sphingomonas sp.]|nr:hypothetical protein [Sphingomonas sp.]
MSIAFTAGLVVVAIVVALLASRRSGPRITTIEYRHDKADEPKDGDNA